MGWISPALAKLTSDDTPLITGPLTNEQVSNIGSINCIGGLVGAISLGFFISLMGSKRALLCLTVPSVTFWLLVYFGNDYYHILLARFKHLLIYTHKGHIFIHTNLFFFSRINKGSYQVSFGTFVSYTLSVLFYVFVVS